MNKIGEVKGKNILLLQGPMGNFFKRLDKKLRDKGANTFRIGLNSGDSFFSYTDNYVPYRGKPENWESFIESFIDKHLICKIFLFGDCRFYQTVARKVAYKNGVDVFVFELGYVRPHYLTMEKYGVNGYSHLSRDREFYNSLPEIKLPDPLHAKQSMVKIVVSSTLYYAFSNIFHYKYPHYEHHRNFSAISELVIGTRGAFRKLIYKFTEVGYEQYIASDLSKKYYFVPLQTHNDFQIKQHSSYHSIEKFIIEVLESFSIHAPPNTYLVFKHHPIDRGRKNYKSFINEQAKLYGIENRVLTFHDVYLPTCLKHAIGTVTINSTVGLTSLGYNIPTITMGDAIYDIEGLTSKGMSLHQFWVDFIKPDKKLYYKFTNYVIETTQLNGSFYGLIPNEFDEEVMYL